MQTQLPETINFELQVERNRTIEGEYPLSKLTRLSEALTNNEGSITAKLVFGNSVGFSDKYFMAHDIDEAKEMFEYACCKRHLHPYLDRIEKWNRWNASWEKVAILSSEPFLN